MLFTFVKKSLVLTHVVYPIRNNSVFPKPISIGVKISISDV